MGRKQNERERERELENESERASKKASERDGEGERKCETATDGVRPMHTTRHQNAINYAFSLSAKTNNDCKRRT